MMRRKERQRKQMQEEKSIRHQASEEQKASL